MEDIWLRMIKPLFEHCYDGNVLTMIKVRRLIKPKRATLCYKGGIRNFSLYGYLYPL